MKGRRATLLLLAAAMVAGCTTPLLPDKRLYLTPAQSVSAGAATALTLGAAYLVLDPLAPNWEIMEAPLAADRIHLALKMKRFYAGGAGEARTVFQRRARELVQYGGFDGYEVMEYNEGMESSMLGSQRVCAGVIRLTGQGYGKLPPARMTPASATKPLS